MDEESLYDEFGNYVGPEIDENVRKTKYRSNPFEDSYLECCVDLCEFSWKTKRRTMQVNSATLRKMKTSKKDKMNKISMAITTKTMMEQSCCMRKRNIILTWRRSIRMLRILSWKRMLKESRNLL